MYDRLFVESLTDAGGKDFIDGLGFNSLKVLTSTLRPLLGNVHKDEKLLRSSATATVLPTGWPSIG